MPPLQSRGQCVGVLVEKIKHPVVAVEEPKNLNIITKEEELKDEELKDVELINVEIN